MSSSISVSASFPKSDLEVMTAFVQDRSNFLDTVVDAINAEGTDASAAQMVTALESGSFINFIPALLLDKDASVRSKALLALGNLIASDNAVVAGLAAQATIRTFESGFSACLGNKRTFKGAVYVLYTAAIYNAGNKAFEKVRARLVEFAKLALMNCETDNYAVLQDIVYALSQLGCAAAINTPNLLSLIEFGSNRARRMALRILGDRISGEFDSVYFRPTYDCFRSVITSGKKLGTLFCNELYWSLSNLITENGMADAFLQDAIFFEAVVEEMLLHPNADVAAECAWTIGNALYNADKNKLKGNFLQRLRADLNNYKNSRYLPNSRIKTVVGEALATIENTLKAHADLAAKIKVFMEPTPVPTPVAPVCVAAAAATPDLTPMEIDYDSSWFIDTKPSYPSEFNLPCEVDIPPSAFELLSRYYPRKTTSRIVHELIRSVEANDNQYTPMPENTVLTVQDLTDLDELGFVVKGGCLGIRANIVSAFFNY
jgi:hypothetical protein